jgi:hypothetical protein
MKLALIEFDIRRARYPQLFMRSLPNYVSALHDDNRIRTPHRTKPMCDHKRRPRSSVDQVVDGLLDQMLTLRIHLASRFIQYQNRRLSQNRPGDAKALLFAAGELAAHFS